MNNEYPSLYIPNIICSSDITLRYFISEGSPDFLSEITHKFVAAGKYGSYSPERIHPGQSSLILLSPKSTTTFSLKADNIDINAFQILRNMAARLSLEEILVSRIEVSCGQETSRKELPIPDEENEDDVYPAYSDILGFRVEWDEDSDFSKLRRMLVEMRSSPSPDAVRTLQDYVKPWYDLLEAGGFALPVGEPAETECIAGMVTQFDEFSCEISVDRFLASETAWNVLINMIGHYSQKISPVSQVIIE